MKVTWSSASGGGCHSNYTGENNFSYDGKKFNNLFVSGVANYLKQNKKYKGKPKDESDSYVESRNFHFENMYLGKGYDSY